MEDEKKVVCVTGGSGFIGTWLVSLLLRRNYTVHATVKNLYDEKETAHLKSLDGADLRLLLFQLDLLNYDSIAAAVHGVSGVFHLASPCVVDFVVDPHEALVRPATEGTMNVLRAAAAEGVDRVVVTSSISAIVPSPDWPGDVVKGEDCWTSLEYCKQEGLWYPISKTLAEKAAWEFAKDNGLDVVVINPGTVFGPILNPIPNASMMMLVRLLNGCRETYKDYFMGCVHVKDVAEAHILLYETKSASGRHLCVEAITHYGDLVAKAAELFPEYDIPRVPRDTQIGLVRFKEGSKKLMELGLHFTPMDQILKDSVDSLKCRGFLD